MSAASWPVRTVTSVPTAVADRATASSSWVVPVGRHDIDLGVGGVAAEEDLLGEGGGEGCDGGTGEIAGRAVAEDPDEFRIEGALRTDQAHRVADDVAGLLGGYRVECDLSVGGRTATLDQAVGGELLVVVPVAAELRWACRADRLPLGVDDRDAVSEDGAAGLCDAVYAGDG